jgi:hypothetical protein
MSLLAVLAACQPVPAEEPTSGYSIIFFDVSASVGDAEMQNLGAVLGDYIRSLDMRLDWELDVYTVDSRIAGPFDRTIERCRHINNREAVRRYKTKAVAIADEAVLWVTENRQRFLKDRPSELQKSCLIDCLCYAADRFHASPGDHKKLLLLSDLLEDCASTGIDMYHSPEDFDAAPESARIYMTDKVFPSPDLSGVEVEMVVPAILDGSATPDWARRVTLSSTWRRILAHAGVRDAAMAKID